MTLYPIGYGTRLVTMDELRAVHEPLMHPEKARRFFPYIESKGGLLGVGGGYRTSPAPGGAPLAKSFHFTQQFRSGLYVYAAIDLVAVNNASLLKRIFSLNGSKGSGASAISRALTVAAVHRSPTWAETADAPSWGLHTFVTSPPEPWHIQPIEIRGWSTWVNAGRPDPRTGYPLPVDPTPPPSGRIIDMYRVTYRNPAWPGAFEATVTGSAVIHSQSANRGRIDAEAGVPLLSLDRGEIVDLLSDIGLTHQSYNPATGGAQNPFAGSYDNGNYYDPELEGLWARRITAG